MQLGFGPAGRGAGWRETGVRGGVTERAQLYARAERAVREGHTTQAYQNQKRP